MKPTQKQIEQEIEKLKDLQPNIRHFSVFGDDNRAQIAAQITVLVDGLDSDDIADRYFDEGEEIYASVLSAREWLNGEYDVDTLSEGWEELRINPPPVAGPQ